MLVWDSSDICTAAYVTADVTCLYSHRVCRCGLYNTQECMLSNNGRPNDCDGYEVHYNQKCRWKSYEDFKTKRRVLIRLCKCYKPTWFVIRLDRYNSALLRDHRVTTLKQSGGYLSQNIISTHLYEHHDLPASWMCPTLYMFAQAYVHIQTSSKQKNWQMFCSDFLFLLHKWARLLYAIWHVII